MDAFYLLEGEQSLNSFMVTSDFFDKEELDGDEDLTATLDITLMDDKTGYFDTIEGIELSIPWHN